MLYNDFGTLDSVKKFIENEAYYFYAHCLIEAKKDGIGPEDILYCLLTGKIIEKYPERKRALVYGMLSSGVPLHVVIDTSQSDALMIVTCYVPANAQWVNYQKRRR